MKTVVHKYSKRVWIISMLQKVLISSDLFHSPVNKDLLYLDVIALTGH